MSFLKRLFGGGAAPEPKVEAIDYEGYVLTPMPKAENGMYRLQGLVARGEGDGRREHMLIRADMFTSAEDAADAFLRKARLLIDQQGEQLFS
ncbi:hypothetical protein CSC94_22110 [Zhengella mangrovi]|uniref:Transcriptional activator HlyU n=1 Tax=Zhengella mangrovi TaxID=1982044 RepID=A0A2G1QH94_9HYPH|nr:HlyU family transcriptional regulator [Zhengella mangrovi]PHP64882.1 hypothetical protein CSC94_22110 [Zhengella mangrovi]